MRDMAQLRLQVPLCFMRLLLHSELKAPVKEETMIY